MAALPIGPLFRLAGILIPFLLVGVPERASAEEETRAAEITAAREKKRQNLAPEELSKGERALQKFREKKILERFSAGIGGFRVKLGGLVSGSGFAIGPEYLRKGLSGGNLMFRSSAQTSFRNYQRYDLQFGSAAAATDRVFFDFYAVHHSYPGIGYYGPGPNSLKSTRTNYRLEDTAADFSAGIHPIKRLAIGGSAGYLWVNVGPGADTRFASSDQVFSPVVSPGIDRQTDFARYGFFTQYDYLDHPGGPRKGGILRVPIQPLRRPESGGMQLQPRRCGSASIHTSFQQAPHDCVARQDYPDGPYRAE